MNNLFTKGNKMREKFPHTGSLGKHWKLSQKTKDKMISSAKNRPLRSETYCKNISKSHMGLTPWNKGKKGLQVAWNKGKHHLQKEDNPNWQGGITSINDKVRNSIEMKLWKKACMERDNFTDQKTCIRGGDLVVHHINNFADFPELRTSIENGITLSKGSHILFHKIYEKHNNTREQLLEFLNNKEI